MQGVEFEDQCMQYHSPSESMRNGVPLVVSLRRSPPDDSMSIKIPKPVESVSVRWESQRLVAMRIRGWLFLILSIFITAT